MIDKEILDAVLPLPTLDELKEQKVEELKDEGFVISNFHSGGRVLHDAHDRAAHQGRGH